MSDDPAPLDQSSITTTAICFEAFLIPGALLLGWLFGQSPLQTVRWGLEDIGWGFLAAVPMFGLLAATIWVPWGPLRNLRQTVEEYLVPLFRGARLYELALLAAAAGIGEELLVRGVIQSAAEQWTHSWWMGLGIAALLFGMAHAVTRTYFVVATLIGAYLGWVWLKTENLITPMVAHSIYDFGALWYLLRRRPVRTDMARS